MEARMMDSLVTIPVIVGFYMLMSVLMLVFNVMYIFKQGRIDSQHERMTEMWAREIIPQLQAMRTKPRGHVDPVHLERLTKKLWRITELMEYFSAMLRMAKRYKAEEIQAYLSDCLPSFKLLASSYALRKDMEKATFAYVLSEFPPKADGMDTSEEMLLPYLTGSSVYCRENTLRALYAMGDVAAVIRAFEILAEQHIFHHEILLAGGLMTFSGDKEALAGQLWKHVPDWPAHMGAAVVQFIEFGGADYRQVFYSALLKPDLNLQVQLSILHYFYTCPFEPMRPILLEYLKGADRMAADLAIVSASVLAAYPGQESISALTSALSSRNWYVRNNTALSLLALGANSNDLDEVLQGSDPYALEMMCYQVQAQDEEDQFPQCARREAKEEWD
jgi:hypothetical protein